MHAQVRANYFACHNAMGLRSFWQDPAQSAGHQGTCMHATLPGCIAGGMQCQQSIEHS
jgi:hypothetical protein